MKTIATLIASVAAIGLLATSAAPANAFFGPGIAYAISAGLGVSLATNGHNTDKPYVDSAALASGKLDITTADASKQSKGYNASIGK